MAHCKYCNRHYFNEDTLSTHEEVCEQRPLTPTAEDKAFKVIEQKQEANQTHPLLNPDSTHYQMIGGVEAITLMETMFTTEELMAWAKLTVMKYRLRIGNKDDVIKEAKKIETYEAYYEYLKDNYVR